MKFINPEIVSRYFKELSENQLSSFVKFGRLYEEVNSKINLVSRGDLENLYERHILHSLSIAKFISFKDNSRVLDLGTGGGFPGIPLAIFFPRVYFTLIDSINKKTHVVDSMVDELDLKNVEVVCDRVENYHEKFDFIVSRATAPMKDLVKWTRGNLLELDNNMTPNGIIALKGGDLDDELRHLSDKPDIVNLSEYFSEDFFTTKKLVYLKR